MMMSNPGTALSFTSPLRGEVGAQRRVRGPALHGVERPLTLALSPEGRGNLAALVAVNVARRGS